jgi:hypothetical protein
MHPIQLMQEQADAFIASGHIKTGAPAGLNGPHQDPETHFRNSAHWLALLCRLGVLTRRETYLGAANDLADFLISQSPLADGRLPVMRMKVGKDAANGVIGAAWLMEGLTVASSALGRQDLAAISKQLSLWFPFDKARKLWITREPNGATTEIDTTLNHQIWFAMACSLLPEPDPQVAENVELFLNGLPQHLKIRKNGIIGHLVKSPLLSKSNAVASVAELLGRYPTFFSKGPLSNTRTRRLVDIALMHEQKEVGYLIFTAHALTRISDTRYGKTIAPGSLRSVYDGIKLISQSLEFRDNPWSFAYNPPGFEFPYIAQILGNSGDLTITGSRLYREQLLRTYDSETKTFSLGNQDPNTMTARLYTLSLCTEQSLDALAEGL